MNFRFKLLFVMAICFMAMGCANPQVSELEKPIGDPYLFVFDDESKVFSIAYHALSREVDSSLIKELNGPVKGFYAHKDAWGSSNNYWIRVFAANGVDSQGRNTYGYYGEVMVEGDKGTERESARKIFGDMEAMFAQQGKKVYVRNLTRAKYRSDSTGDYKSGSYDFDSAPRREQPRQPEAVQPRHTEIQPVPRDTELAEPARGEYVPPQQIEPQRMAPSTGAPVGASMADELRKLNELRQQGILSDEEFQRAKERVLNW